jgi:hypothetical protein
MSEKNKKTLKKQRLWLGITSYLVLVGPVLGVLIANHARYFTTAVETFKVGTGALIGLVMVALLIGGKLRVPSGLVVLLFMFIMSWLLGNLLEDLMLLSGCALVGKALDWIFIAPHLHRLQKRIDRMEQADVTASAVKAALGGTGRV